MTTTLSTAEKREVPQALRAGRSWHYEDGFLVNQFLGRCGHTPSWIVEVEGSAFRHPEPTGLVGRVVAMFRPPRIVRRNERRLAFAWPLRWPPPDQEESKRLVARALALAGTLGRTLPFGCGVCGRSWEGGPTMMEERARHLCPECAVEIERVKSDRPPGVGSTWLWCVLAGFCGLWLEVLCHWTLGWSTAPLALVAGWLAGSANAPNLDRQPLVSAVLTFLLICVFQALGLTLVAATGFAFYELWDLTRLFVWTLSNPGAPLVTGCLFGAAGLALAHFERRLRKA